MNTVFSIHDLECASCAIDIEGACEDLPGVHRAEVHIHKKELTVEHDAAVTPMMVTETLQRHGHDVRRRE